MNLEMNHVLRQTRLPFVDAVYHFMGIAGQYRAKFAPDQVTLYTGLQLEELAEQLMVISEGCLTPSTRAELTELALRMHTVGNEFKQGLHRGDIMRCNHANLIDGQFDSMWVAAGALISTSSAPYGAIAHGAYTNLSKFPSGKAIKDENGKVQKPPGWQPPDFEPFTDPTARY
jgi:predicted HAD superfamily Cof-like phosphohydrolase